MATIWKFYVPIGDGNSMFHLEVLYIIFYKSIFHIIYTMLFYGNQESSAAWSALLPPSGCETRSRRRNRSPTRSCALRHQHRCQGMGFSHGNSEETVRKPWYFPWNIEETMVFPMVKIYTGNHGISHEDHGGVPVKVSLKPTQWLWGWCDVLWMLKAGTTWQVNKLAANIAKQIIRDHGWPRLLDMSWKWQQ